MKFLLLWVLVEVGGALPARVLYALADIAGVLTWLSSPPARRVTRDHMDRVLGPAIDVRARDRAARGCVRSTMRYWMDFARASHLEPAVVFDEFQSFEGIAHLFAAVDRGCGVVLITAHLGAPEFAMRVASSFGLDILALTEQLEPPKLNALLQRARRRRGGRYVEVDLGGVRDALEQLRGGGLVALVADRDVLGSGVPTTLFGALAPLPPGPIELALRTGAAAVPCFVLRTDAAGSGVIARPRYVVRFLPALEFPRTGDRAADLPGGLAALARALETGIALAPDQWFTLQPVWRQTVPSVPRPDRARPKMKA